METKYKIGDDVISRVTNTVGIVITINIVICDSGTQTRYEVTFPDESGLPCSRLFYEVELNPVDFGGKLGFRTTET